MGCSNIGQNVNMLNSCLEDIYIAWRVAIHRVWRVTWKTLGKLLPHLVNCMDVELRFSRRCMRFIKMAINSCNIVVKTITNMGIYGLHFVMEPNKKISRIKVLYGGNECV